MDQLGRSFRLQATVAGVDPRALLALRAQLLTHHATREQRLVLEVLELSGLTRALRGRRAGCLGVAVSTGQHQEPPVVCQTRADVERLRAAHRTFTLYGVRARDESGKGASWSSHPSEVVTLQDHELADAVLTDRGT